MTSESKAEADEMRAFYETLYAAVPEEARRFAEVTWGEMWAHAEMGSLMDFAALASTAGAGAGDWVTVPRDALEAMWGGLARQIVMWCRFGQPTGKALFQHLKSSGYEIPAWLREEVEDVDHVPPKGTVAVIIYRAMIEAAPAVPASPRSGAGDDLEQATADQIKAGLEVFQVSHPAPAEHGAEIRELHAALSKGHALLCESGPDRCWVKIGFGWLQDAQDAHGALARFIKPAPAQSPSTSEETSPDTTGAKHD